MTAISEEIKYDSVRILDIGPVKTGIYRFADTVGDGTGTKNAIGNYAALTEFKLVPAANQIFRINRLIPHIRDGQPFRADRYGGLGAALSTGISVRVKGPGGNIIQDLTDSLTIKTNADWGRYCYDLAIVNFSAGDDFLHARWTFTKAGQPIRLIGANGEYLSVDLQDNFTGLVEQYFMFQGTFESP